MSDIFQSNDRCRAEIHATYKFMKSLFGEDKSAFLVNGEYLEWEIYTAEGLVIITGTYHVRTPVSKYFISSNNFMAIKIIRKNVIESTEEGLYLYLNSPNK